MGYFAIFIYLYVGLVTFSLSAEDVCVKKGPCTCEFYNGTGIDLQPVASEPFFTAQFYEVKDNGTTLKLSTFYYHPCTDLMPQFNSSKVNNTCDTQLSICQQIETLVQINDTKTYKSDGGRHDFLGTNNISEFSPDGRAIKYPNGPSYTQVLLICAETDNQLHVYSLENPRAMVLSFYSRHACLEQMETGRSLGSTLLIIFFSCVIFYLVLGICTKKFLMGATGIEIVPNLAFWSDLPNLVKDGWAFALSGFKLPPRASGHMTSPDPNSYDSI